MQLLWLAIRILAALVGAWLGWLLAGVLVRLLARLIFRRPAPWPVRAALQLLAAVALGLLIYYYLHPGGSGGWGLGGGGFGLGGGRGTGTGGTASATGTTQKAATQTTNTSRNSTSAAASDTLTIEMLGGERYKGEGRYYLVAGKEPAKTLEEVRVLLQRNRGRYRKLEIVLYPDSVAALHPAVSQLEALAQQFGLSRSLTQYDRR